MKKGFLFAMFAILFAACNNNTFTIKGTLGGDYVPTKEIEVSLAYQDGDSIITLRDVVKDRKFCFTVPVKEEQLASFTIIGIGRQMIALEKGTVNINIVLSPDGQVIDFTLEGTVNNDFIQKLDSYENDVYTFEQNAQSEEEMDRYFETIIDKVYHLIKGDENSLININTLAGWYGYLNYSYNFSFEQKDTLCSMMNEKTLHNESMKRAYDVFQIQKTTSIGEQYIDITALTPLGDTLSLSEIVGKTDYVLVDFWASWCGPCRRSMPALKELYDKSREKLEILGVSLDAQEDDWKAAINDLELNWLQVSDLNYWQAQGAQDYGVNSIPATVLINRDGVIVGRNLSISEIENLLYE